jgi:uncharacterized protein YlxW (UPF0749 family)
VKVEVDIDEVAAKVISGLEKKVVSLQNANAKLENRIADYKKQMAALEGVREAIVNAAYLLDPEYGYDD